MAEILVEVRAPAASGDIARRRPATPESFASRAGEITDTITEVAEKLHDHLEAGMGSRQSALWQLGTVELAFSLALQAETGVVIARASAEATFSVTLTWSKGRSA
jgi:NTP-dependent ternary system trypsin peptidase co-occuring protein